MEAENSLNEDGLLCHYTDMNGLLGIIKSKKLWATNIAYLNDSSEYHDAIRIFNKVIDTLLTNTPDITIQQKEFLESIKSNVEGFAGISDLDFITSFTSSPDLLSQWRGYGNGTSGYCLQFSENEIRESLSSKSQLTHKIVKCIYDENKKRHEINTLLRKKLDQVQDAKGEGVTKSINSTIYDLHSTSASFKNHNFSQEGETRIITTGIKNNKPIEPLKHQFRQGIYNLIPYTEVPFPQESLKAIKIGPTLDQPKARHALELLLKAHCYYCNQSPPQISYSEIPFRSW